MRSPQPLKSERLRVAAGKFVSRRSDEQLARLEHGPQRRVMLETMIAAMRRRFDPVVAGDLDTVVEFRLLDDGSGPAERYQVTIRRGECTITRGGSAKPETWFTLSAADLLRMGTGAASWPQLLGTRRVELGGDPFTGLRILSVFGISARAAGD
jgi:hypothetical protein